MERKNDDCLARAHGRAATATRPLALAGHVALRRRLLDRREAVVAVGRRGSRSGLGSLEGGERRSDRNSGGGCRLGRGGSGWRRSRPRGELKATTLASSGAECGRRRRRRGRRPLPRALGSGARSGWRFAPGEGLLGSLLLKTDLLEVGRPLGLALLASSGLRLLLRLLLPGLNLGPDLGLLGRVGVLFNAAGYEKVSNGGQRLL